MRIGISQKILYDNGSPHDALDQGWYNVLNGHSLYFLPNAGIIDFDHVADNLDSFIITGGEEVDKRREIELKLANRMIARGKPVVGTDRGALLIAELLNSEIETKRKHVTKNYPIIYHGEVIEVPGEQTLGILKMNSEVEILCTDYKGYVEAFISGNIAGIVWSPERMNKPWIPPEIALLLRI